MDNELFPLLVFIGIGAMTDFGPLLENPRMMLLGAAGQFGIFGTLILALLLGFDLNEAASIGIIGAIDGPTSIYVSNLLAPHLLGPIAVTAYSYMSLVPIIQPPIMRALTSRKERMIRMPYTSRTISRRTRVIFPLAVDHCDRDPGAHGHPADRDAHARQSAQGIGRGGAVDQRLVQ